MKKNNFSTHKSIYLFLLRILAIFLVVLLHASAIVVVKYGQIGTDSWLVANLFDSITRPSVAILFMVSGALLLPKNEPLGVFYKKRFVKILIPFYFWQLFYLFYSLSFQIEPFISALKTRNTYYDLLFGYNYTHLWFIPIIIQIYLITPILRRWILSVKKSQVFQGLFIWGTIIILNDASSYILGKSMVTSNFVFGLGYFLLGYYLSSLKFTLKPRIAVLFLVLSLGITASFTAIITIVNKSLSLYPYSYSSIQNCVAAILFFILIRQINWPKISSILFVKIVSFISSSCFGIYLVHLILLELIVKKFPFFFFPPMSNWYDYLFKIPILAIITFLASLVIISILKTNKFTEKIV
jgi:surface polysaccharide O-acyltransferase-like enzyme